MTNVELPTAAQALAMAIGCAQRGEAELGSLWLGIAVEIRTDAQYRSVNERLFPGIDNTKAVQPATTLPAEALSYGDLARRMSPFAKLPEAVPAEDPAPDFSATRLLPIVEHATVTWNVGDKADCAHCHTPIVLCFRETEQQTYGEGGDEVVWLHKYTDLAVCQTPVIAEAEAEEAVYTYAEPALRG